MRWDTGQKASLRHGGFHSGRGPGMLTEMHAETRPSAGSTGTRRRVKQHSGAMTAHPEYTLTLPPTCPRKWDDLNVHCL